MVQAKTIYFSQAATLTLIALLCSACSQSTITPHYNAPQTKDGKMLGTIHLASDDSSKLNLYRVQKGYALKANLDKDTQSERKGDLVFSKNKSRSWFAGLQWQFAF